MRNTDYRYYNKWNFSHIFNYYTGNAGYVVFKPWAGGFNNIRMSLELAVCIAYLGNKTLVLPQKYKMYLLKDDFGMEDFFDVTNLGVKNITFKEFCALKNIQPTFDAVKEVIPQIITEKNYSQIASSVFNFEKDQIPNEFTKNRDILNFFDFVNNNESIYLDACLLGNFYQTIYSHKLTELKQLIAKHVRYVPELFELGEIPINWLGDREYYAMHVRRNEFEYRHLFITAEQILDNIKDVIPFGAKLYIATDHYQYDFFNPLAKKYDLYFFNNIQKPLNINCHYNYIPIVEQLICSRAIKFVGNDLSTLSSYVYRMRGYMNDIEDKNYYINTTRFSKNDQINFENLVVESVFNGNWTREYKDSWSFMNV